MEWHDEESFTIDGVSFLRVLVGEWKASDADRFCVLKPRDTLDHLVGLIKDHQPKNIVELGIYHGGSTAMAALLAQPDKMVAVDISETRIGPLDALIAERQLNVEAHYGVDQGNREQLAEILDAAFGTTPLDLVLDDASHRPDLTRVSFELLFPRLRPGGLFVIEDWRWPPLSMLILEQILAFVGVDHIGITRHSTILRRSDAPLAEPFVLRDALPALFATVFEKSDEFTVEKNDALRALTFGPSSP